MSEPPKAVFLSYASQDAEAARRICECLRSAGIEVWFDQSELRGGDVWDHKIRQQIHDCALFVPLISAHTDARTEGYFRLEWKLAVDRSYLMADDAAFLLPVVIDDTPDAGARVPEKFRTVQWTRLPAGQTPPAFAQRVGALLSGTERPVPVRAATMAQKGDQSAFGARGKAIASVAVLALIGVALLAGRYLTRAPQTTIAKAASPAVVIPEHSIAVLPFINLSAGKNQEYFSDGLAEELLNVLSKVPGLQVAARTSAFSFKGHAVDVRTIGRQLLVAHVLEGSVRMVGNHLRVTAQLVRTDKGYQIWSETYDRELGDVFRIQDEISAAVVKALKVSLLGSAAPHSSVAQSTDAYLVFLQGRSKMASDRLADTQGAAQDFTRVLKLDPNYAPAYVELAAAKLRFAEFDITENRQADFEAAKAQAKELIEQALILDPKNAQAYIERGYLRAYSRDPTGAESDFRRGIALNPNSARGYNALAELLYGEPNRLDEALAMLLRARQLDPLQPKYDILRAKALFYRRSDLATAGALLADLVNRDPQNSAAQMLLAELRLVEGHYADSAMHYESGLKLDPLADWARRALILDYVSVGDLAAAEQVASEAPHRLPIHRLSILLYQGNWTQAALVSFGAFADGTLLELDWGRAALALRMDARRGGDYPRARAMLEKLCGVSWGAGGVPTLPTQFDMGSVCVALGDVLIASGERAEGERLLRASIAAMDYNAHELKHKDFWYVYDRALALALLGDTSNSLAALRVAIHAGDQANPWSLKSDPAFNALRSDEEFQGFVRTLDQRSEFERQAMVRLRAGGRLPDRSRAAPKPAVKSP